LNADPAVPESAPEVIHEIKGWRRLLLLPLGLLARAWGRSLRFELEPEDLKNISKNDEPLSLVLWHNRLFLAAEIFRRYRRRPAYALVSASRDGAWLAAFFAIMGLPCVRGSSSNLGREAVTAMIEKLRAGSDIGITPDGPRGPMYDFKRGAFIVTRRAGAPALLIGGRFHAARRLKSWDGFYLPRPFSRVRVVCRLVTAAELRAPETTVDKIRDRLLAINPD
jgi:lysophospholipid acyltransferase (LPLAT)-like uncharacterized protein